jgi:trigger factor
MKVIQTRFRKAAIVISMLALSLAIACEEKKKEAPKANEPAAAKKEEAKPAAAKKEEAKPAAAKPAAEGDAKPAAEGDAKPAAEGDAKPAAGAATKKEEPKAPPASQ